MESKLRRDGDNAESKLRGDASTKESRNSTFEKPFLDQSTAESKLCSVGSTAESKNSRVLATMQSRFAVAFNQKSLHTGLK